MTKDEALKLALEFIERVNKDGWILADFEPQMYEAITVIKAALAQPEQEPVAHPPCKGMNCGITRTDQEHSIECQAEHAAAIAGGQFVKPEQEPKCGAIIEVFGKDWRLEYMSLPVGKHKLYTQQYTYTTPPQRTLVGLTDEERNNLWREVVGWGDPSHDDEDLMKTIEAKLKEKNT